MHDKDLSLLRLSSYPRASRAATVDMTSMDPSEPLQDIIRVLQYVFPAILLAYYVVAQTASICTLRSGRTQNCKVQRKPLIFLQSAVLMLYTIEALLLVLNSLLSHASIVPIDGNIHVLLEICIWIMLTVSLAESGNDVVWYPLYGSWFISVATEIVLFGLEIPAAKSFTNKASAPLRYVRIILKLIRLILLVFLLLLYFHGYTTNQDEKDEESASLLPSIDTLMASESARGGPVYGSTEAASIGDLKDGNIDTTQVEKDRLEQERWQRLESSGNWIIYLKRFSLFIPLLWPTRQLRVQLSFLGVVICVVAGRAMNLLVPRQLGIVIDSLPDTLAHQAPFPTIQLGLLIFYQFLNSHRTIGELQKILWMPFSQHAEKTIKITAHKKVMALSRDFQTQKSTAEIIKSIDQGINLIWLVNSVSMYMLPYALDVLISGVYLSHVFGSYMALLLGVTAIVQLWVSARLASKRVKPQREALGKDRREAQVLFESIGHWDSITLFGGQASESERLSTTVRSRLLAEFKLMWLEAKGSVLEEVIMKSSFAIACALVIYQIVDGRQKIGDFAMMVLYFLNAQHTLHYLASMGRSYVKQLVDAETLRDLLLSEPSVQDGSAHFRFYQGAVLFNDVSFGYDKKKTIIQNFSFSAKPGQRIALVGETGAGKTSILRLLFRFYDVQTGKIMIDGQDIRNVTLSTLRSVMGVVPQDPSLFNTSIIENVRYSKCDASDEEVVEACKAAAIHDKILTYADGYLTKVGEHGIKLSGGEKQRIAIARVMLKKPKIILLDEATSSVDTETEGLIQTALRRLTSGRTTFTVAHRLSTVNNADVVLVMKDGRIVEQGSPAELLDANGHFSRLWRSQFKVEDDQKANQNVAREESSRSHQGTPIFSRHVSERSGGSFRPDAPEFIPNYQRSTAASSSSQPAHGHQDKVGHVHCHDISGGKNDRGLSKRPQPQRNKKDRKRANESEATSEAVSTDWYSVAPGSQYDGPCGMTLTENNPPQRLNRWQRRCQTRSDPHGPSLGSSQADGVGENLNAFKDGAHVASRRVSGPSNYPSGAMISKATNQDPKSVKGQSQNLRRKHQRRPRTKKNEKSTQQPGAVSGEASSAWSTDSHVVSKPKTSNLTSENDIHVSKMRKLM